MQPPPRMRVKICCIGSAEEARLAIRYGASALGLVSAMPSGPGVIAEELIGELAAQIPPGVTSVLLTSRQDVEAISAQQRRCRVNALQICDRLDLGDYARLRQALPGIGLIQVIHAGGAESLEEARAVAPLVDAPLLDSGNQALAANRICGPGRMQESPFSPAI